MNSNDQILNQLHSPQSNPSVVLEIVWEHERGININNKQRYSSKLLPTDPPQFTSGSLKNRVNLRYFNCPSNYEWVSDWTVDMNGMVDTQGYTYNINFETKINWVRQVPDEVVVIVRKRKWSRIRRVLGLSNPLRTPVLCDNLLLSMQNAISDNLRLVIFSRYIADLSIKTIDVQGFIDDEIKKNPNFLSFILSEFECDNSRLEMCLILAPYILDSRSLILSKCLSMLAYGFDRIKLLQATAIHKDDYSCLL